MNTVIEEVKNGAYIITLNRPERKNALNAELLADLRGALENAGKQGNPVIVIRGSGGSFSAGGDIGEFRELVHRGESLGGGAAILHDCVMIIRGLEAITIAVLEGAVAGAGVGISLVCDLSVASKDAVMNMAYRRIGLTPDGGGSISLPRIVGAKKANELYFLARNVGMDEALTLGLVNFAWDKDELETRLDRLIKDLAALPTEAIGPYKTLVNDAVFAGLADHLAAEGHYLSELGAESGFEERLEAFFRRK